jgi:hypothetical protein
MLRASKIRLPGVYFLPSPRPRGLGLPPLDVAAFVGFAERGPLDLPVAVEDLSTFRSVFGGGLALAREQGGAAVHANLPTAVASFFANGGRRCYVVRVAGERARRTRLVVRGMVSFKGLHEPSTEETPKLAAVYASSEGRWSEDLRVGARLRATPMPEAAFKVLAPRRADTGEGEETVFALSWETGDAPRAIQRGDVLRLGYNAGRQYLFPVEEVRPVAGETTATRFELLSRYAWRVVRADKFTPLRVVAAADLLTHEGVAPLNLRGELSAEALPGGGGGLAPGELKHRLLITHGDASGLRRYDVLRVKTRDNLTFLFHVDGLSGAREPGGALRRVAWGAQMLRLPGDFLPSVPPSSLLGVERLRFDLLLRQGRERLPTVEELSFNEGHPRFWGDVVPRESGGLRRGSGAGNQRTEAGGGAETPPPPQSDSSALAGLLAPAEERGRSFMPLGMASILNEEDIVGHDERDARALGSDDLGAFDPGLFVDPALVPRRGGAPGEPTRFAHPATGEALMKEAFDRHYIQGKRLRGLHSLLFIDEVALVSLPEAVQREWPGEPAPEDPPRAAPPAPPPPDLSLFLECGPPVTSPPLTSPPVTSPPSAPTRAPGLPTLKRLDPHDETDAQYRREMSNLIEAQHALLTFCEARLDAVGILTLPRFYEKRHCVRWHEEFRAHLGLPRRRSASAGRRDPADLSYVAVYHPWLLLADAESHDRLRAAQPDGAACGTIAARERERQVWVAPANVPLHGVLGLATSFGTADRADLFDLGFNLVREEPDDFRAMSAHTLSDESIWLQLSVRRLLILLRKFVVERGMDFVFESNSERFRDGVRLMLEDALRSLHDRGAFAGASPEQSFRVTTDASVNPPSSLEAGRFVAQIQVAPSQPLEFITVLLTRVGEDLLQTKEA